jgi:hypothetical protein
VSRRSQVIQRGIGVVAVGGCAVLATVVPATAASLVPLVTLPPVSVPGVGGAPEVTLPPLTVPLPPVTAPAPPGVTVPGTPGTPPPPGTSGPTTPSVPGYTSHPAVIVPPPVPGAAAPPALPPTNTSPPRTAGGTAGPPVLPTGHAGGHTSGVTGAPTPPAQSSALPSHGRDHREPLWAIALLIALGAGAAVAVGHRWLRDRRSAMAREPRRHTIATAASTAEDEVPGADNAWAMLAELASTPEPRPAIGVAAPTRR